MLRLLPLTFALTLVTGLLMAGCDTAATEDAAPLAVTYDDARPDTVDPFLDTLQANTFRWFWETTDNERGLTPDRYPTRTFSSIAAIGFGLTAYGVGVERGYIPRADAVERTLNTLRFFWEAPQGPEQIGRTGFKGFFYHFLEYDTGTRYRNTELSTIDTALLMGGVLFAREYYTGTDADEVAIRAYADSLFQRIEWDWFRKQEPRVAMGWYPEANFGQAEWEGYNEAMLLYIMALGTPSFELEPGVWDAWTETYEWADYYGYEHVNFEPLFGHQYSHLWIDFRGIQDAYMRGRGIDYFENSRRATLSQRAYAIDNPMDWEGYSADIWGLTACDGPAGGLLSYKGEERRFFTYSARGVSAQRVVDDGTITPTAAGGSIPFAPEETIAALKAMRAQYGDALFTEYGFRDAFNPSFTPDNVDLGDRVLGANDTWGPDGWFNGDYLGIDQGPILLMAENYRSDFVWETMRKSPYLIRGLKRAGFTGGWLDDEPMPEIETVITERQADPADTFADKRLVVILGSSTAAGVGPERSANAWANRYRTYLQGLDPSFDVLNLARGGYTTYHILPSGTEAVDGRPDVDTTRNITRALSFQPDAVIVAMTSNDRAYGYENEEQLRNFDALIAAAEAQGVPVWITTTTPRNLDEAGRQDQYALRTTILERYGDRAINIWDGIALEDYRLDPQWDSGDNLHLNDEAHALLFERIQAADLDEMLLEETSTP
ncbi:MAG: glucoamylase family protein [Bacteroidota bacterium]